MTHFPNRLRRLITMFLVVILTSWATPFSGGVKASGESVRYLRAPALADNYVNDVFASGNDVYVATAQGLSVSTDGGVSFSLWVIPDLSPTYQYIMTVFVDGETVYAGSYTGLSWSEDGGLTWTTELTDSSVTDVYARGDDIYFSTEYDGLFISDDGGLTFEGYGYDEGLGGDQVTGIYVDESDPSGPVLYTTSAPDSPQPGGVSWANLNDLDEGFSNADPPEIVPGDSELWITEVVVSGGLIYLATGSGVIIGTPNPNPSLGPTWSRLTMSSAALGYVVTDIFIEASDPDNPKIYASLDGAGGSGLTVSSDGGATWTDYSFSTDLLVDNATSVFVDCSTDLVYVGVKGFNRDVSYYLEGGVAVISGAGCSVSEPSSSSHPLRVVKGSIDPNGGRCTFDGLTVTSSTTFFSFGYRYLPGPGECMKDGATFAGWARASSPSTAVSLPLLRHIEGGNVWRYFISDADEFVAVWTT